MWHGTIFILQRREHLARELFLLISCSYLPNTLDFRSFSLYNSESEACVNYLILFDRKRRDIQTSDVELQ